MFSAVAARPLRSVSSTLETGHHFIGAGTQFGGQGDLVPQLQGVDLPEVVVDAPVVPGEGHIAVPDGGVLEVPGASGQRFAVRTLIDSDAQANGRDLQRPQVPGGVVEVAGDLGVAGRGDRG